jgi:hypothetical protein
MRQDRSRVPVGGIAGAFVMAAVLASSLAVSMAGRVAGQSVDDVFPATPYLGIQVSYAMEGATLDDPFDDLANQGGTGPLVRSYTGTYGTDDLAIYGEVTLQLPPGYPASAEASVTASVQVDRGAGWEVLVSDEQVARYGTSRPVTVGFDASAPAPSDPDAAVRLVVEVRPPADVDPSSFVQVVATLAVEGGGEVVIPEQTPEPIATDGPTDPGDLQLTRVEGIPAAFGQLADVIPGGPGFIAVGSGMSDPEGWPEGMILTSTDGFVWDRVPLPPDASIELVDVTEWAGGYAALGWGASMGEVAVWSSSDGIDWQQASLPVPASVFEAYPITITGTEEGLLAVGCNQMSAHGECGGAPVAWTSSDGITWDRSRLRVTKGFSPEDIASMGRRLVLVGSTEWGVGAPAGATSIDGATWTTATLDGTGVLANGQALDDATLVATGWATDGDSVDRGRVAWSSDSGETWEDFTVAQTESEYTDISLLADTIIVGCVGSQRCWIGTPAAWALDEAGDPIPIGADPATDQANGRMDAFAPFADQRGGVAVGWTSLPDGTGSQPGVWVITAGPGPETTPGQPPAPTPKPRRTPPPTPQPPVASFTEAQQYLLSALPKAVRQTCVPRLERLAEGTVGAIDCYPDDPAVQATAYYLMSADDAQAVFQLRVDENLTRQQQKDFDTDCAEDRPGIPSRFSTGSSALVTCYYDDQGRPNFRIVNDGVALCHPDPLTVGGVVVRDPAVYYAILGPDTVRLPELDAALHANRLGWDYPDASVHQEVGCP